MDKLTFSPIELTLFDENDEPIKTLSKSIIRWHVLKQAVKLAKTLETEQEALSESAFDALSAFVCRLFDDKITPGDLEKGADISEVMACFKQVVRRANNLGNA